MKGILKLISACSLLLLIVSCADDEPKVDPIVGLWELDDASLEFTQSGYEYAEFSKDNDLYGESAYTIEFKKDFTYEREIDDIPGFGDHSEEGEWELDGEDLDLDSEDPEVGGLSYAFTLKSVTATSLTLEATEEQELFHSAKISEWFDDGTLDSNGTFTLTDTQIDSLYDNFTNRVDALITLKFDKQ